MVVLGPIWGQVGVPIYRAAVLSGYLIHLWFCVGKPMTGLGENVKLLRILILFVLPFNF